MRLRSACAGVVHSALPSCTRARSERGAVIAAFSKLKALIRKTAAGTYDELWQAAGDICHLLPCRNRRLLRRRERPKSCAANLKHQSDLCQLRRHG